MYYILIIRAVSEVINTLFIKCKVKNFLWINRLKPTEKSVKGAEEKMLNFFGLLKTSAFIGMFRYCKKFFHFFIP